MATLQKIARGPVDPRDETIRRQQACLNDYLQEISRLERALASADGEAMRFAKLYEISQLKQGKKVDLKRFGALWQCIKRNLDRVNGKYTGVSDGEQSDGR